MKTITLIISLLLFSIKTYSQDCRNLNCHWNDTLNLSTGINTSGNLIHITPGSVVTDPFWKRVNYPQITGTCNNMSQIVFPKAYVIAGYDDWNKVTNDNNEVLANILSAVHEYSFGCDNDDSTQAWIFRRSFGVCSDHSHIRIQANLRADDEGRLYLIYPDHTEVYIMRSFLNSGYSVDYAADCWRTASLDDTLDLDKGCYQLEFRLSNTDSQHMGFALNCVLTDVNNTNSLSNPSDSCCADGTITVRKILDKDCNLSWNTGDLNGEDWSFSLNNSNDITIDTQTTNHWGEAVFSGLQSGTYTVTEQQHSGWISNPTQNTSQQVQIVNSGGALVTFYNCPDTLSLDTCCNIADLSAVLTQNNGIFNLNLNGGSVPVQEVEISMVDYHATYSEPDCQPVNMDGSGGNIGYMTTTTTNLSSLVLSTDNHNQNNSHVLLWLPGTPAVINNQINFTVQQPEVLDISCCDVHFWFCIKVRVKDINCNVCEKILCYPSSNVCACGSWNNDPVRIIGIRNSNEDELNTHGTETTRIRGKNRNPRDYVGHAPEKIAQPLGTPVNCGGTITLAKGEYIFSVPDFICSPASCNATYEWAVQGPVNGNGTGKPYGFNFTMAGTYTVMITPSCELTKCEPCTFTLIIHADSCTCRGLITHDVTINWYNPEHQQVTAICPNSPDKVIDRICKDTQVTGTFYQYICLGCEVTYTWEILHNGQHIAGDVNSSSTAFSFTPKPNETDALYELWVTPKCGNQVCQRECTIGISVTKVINCQ